jgi:hypothetical protein
MTGQRYCDPSIQLWYIWKVYHSLWLLILLIFEYDLHVFEWFCRFTQPILLVSFFFSSLWAGTWLFRWASSGSPQDIDYLLPVRLFSNNWSNTCSATSNFRCGNSTGQHTYVQHMCRNENIDTSAAEELFKELQADAFSHVNELLSQVSRAAQRLWTSHKIMRLMSWIMLADLVCSCWILHPCLCLDGSNHFVLIQE